MRIEIEVDTSEVDRDLSRIALGPNATAHIRFAQALTGQWLMAKAAVHIETGSLFASLHMSTPVSFHNGDWSAEIVAGAGGVPDYAFPGPPRDPGKYAIFEFERGGDHDWIRSSYDGGDSVKDREGEYSRIITDWMRGMK